METCLGGPVDETMTARGEYLSADLIEQFEILIRRDPARRGLIGCEDTLPPLCPGHLAQAAAHIAEFGTHVAIVTGFFVPLAEPPAAETDGPPGAAQLAFALESAGIAATIVTDEHCASAVTAAASAMEIPTDAVCVLPSTSRDAVAAFFASGPGATLSHLIAVERVGPGHSPDSIRRQPGGEAMLARFLAEVPETSFGRCHNMRGEIIDGHTGNLHALFDSAVHCHPEMKTIGIGDGGNEIGMGSIAWQELVHRLDGERASRIICQSCTDWTILAGTSNWGACALAASIVLLRGCPEALRNCDARRHEYVLLRMVNDGPAVDGITRRRQPTVDGLPFLTYIQPWEEIRRLLEQGQ